MTMALLVEKRWIGVDKRLKLRHTMTRMLLKIVFVGNIKLYRRLKMVDVICVVLSFSRGINHLLFAIQSR